MFSSRSASFADDKIVSRSGSFADEKIYSRSSSFADNKEIMDGMVTRSRGELRRLCSSNFNGTPGRDSVSPREKEKIHSPRVSELRGEGGGKGPFSPRSGEARRSNLGKN